MFFDKAISPLMLMTAVLKLLFILFWCPGNIYGNHAQEKYIGELEIGKPAEREMAGGQVHQYRLILSRGEYLHVVVEQRGIDVIAVVIDPEGKEIFRVDSPNGTQGPEIVYLIAKSSGSHRLEVRALDKESAPGRYEPRIEALRIATPQDNSRVAWNEAFAEGMKLKAQSTAESLRAAIGKFQEALNQLRDVDEPGAKARTLDSLGEVYKYLGDVKKAFEIFLQELPLWRAVGDRNGEALALNNIGFAYNSLGENRKALDYYNQSLLLTQALDNRSGEAMLVQNIGHAYEALGEKRKALGYYNQSLQLMRAVGYRSGEALVLNNIGYVYSALGERQKALDYYLQSLQLSRALGDHNQAAIILNNIGRVYYSLGERQKALDYYNQSLPIMRATGNRSAEARMLDNIGQVYFSLGEKQKAFDYFHQSLSLSRATEDRNVEAYTLNNLGRVYYSLGEKQKALGYYDQSLRLKRIVEDRQGEAATLNNIASVYIDLGEWQKALEHLNPSLHLFRAVYNPDGEASARYNIARVEQQRGNLTEARSHIETALGIIESLRAKVDIDELRASYFATIRDYYEIYIDLMLHMHKQAPSAGHDAVALEAGERARARSLLETLSEASADIRQGVDPQLLEREHTLQQHLNAKASAQIELLGGKHTAAQAEAIAKQIDTLTMRLREVKAEIRKSSPRYATLTQPQPLKVSEIQQQVLDQDTLLLAYFLGQKQSYLWAVTPTSITTHQLPPRVEIEDAAIKIYNLLTARAPGSERTQAGQRASAMETDSKYWSRAAFLSKMLLGPIASQLGKKRLVIVADGALQYVPFAALPAPSDQNGAEDGEDQKFEADPQPLIEEHEIVSLPSASTLMALRRETAGRNPAEKSLAVLADPVFTNNDSRVRRKEIKVAHKAGAQPTDSDDPHVAYREMTRSGQETGVIGAEAHFGRLLSTRHEAAAILALVPERERKQALDFEASRATALSSELSQYRVVHFATHGLLNNIHPELSGIVLSLVDKRGDPQNGFLRLHEIYNLKLPAELVVLSACQTGLGKEIKGEGLIGLTRGFMYAGTPRVVASLWKIDDRASSELMKRFYQGLLGPERLRPAEALRAAQLSIRKQKQWRAPYYWAAFVLQGEWK